MLHAFVFQLKKDLLLAYRHVGELAHPLLFFLIVVSLFPFGVSPAKEILASIAPGVIWVAALLSTLLALDGMFRTDYEDGTLEQMLLSPYPVAILVLAKVLAHWLVAGLPLILFSPLLAVLMHLPTQAFSTLLISLLLGTPTLSLIGAIGVALTVGLRGHGLLLTLLVLPLYIPVLIFGAGVVQAAVLAFNTTGQLYILASMLVLAVTLAPIAAAAALRISLN